MGGAAGSAAHDKTRRGGKLHRLWQLVRQSFKMFSVLMAKGAVKVQAARKLASKHDTVKYVNKSKYSIGAPSKRVAETFNIFLSLGDNYPLVQLSKGQKYFELKLDDKISSSDEFF